MERSPFEKNTKKRITIVEYLFILIQTLCVELLMQEKKIFIDNNQQQTSNERWCVQMKFHSFGNNTLKHSTRKIFQKICTAQSLSFEWNSKESLEFSTIQMKLNQTKQSPEVLLLKMQHKHTLCEKHLYEYWTRSKWQNGNKNFSVHIFQMVNRRKVASASTVWNVIGFSLALSLYIDSWVAVC